VTYRYASYAIIMFAMVAMFAGCGNSPVAVVDGVKITEREFTDRLISTFGHDMLRDMIDRELLRQAAADAGIEITEEQLDQEIQQAKAQFDSEEQFNQWLASRNLTQDEWREHVRMMMITRALALKDVQYTEEDLKKFFEENKERFARPALVSLSEIVVNSRADAEEVLAELKKGETSFGDLARRYSLSPATKDRGGERPEMPIDNIPIESIREVARSLPIGQASEPIAAEGQWYIIRPRTHQAAVRVGQRPPPGGHPEGADPQLSHHHRGSAFPGPQRGVHRSTVHDSAVRGSEPGLGRRRGADPDESARRHTRSGGACPG